MESTHDIPTIFPYGAATQAEVMNIVRMNGNEDDVKNLAVIMTNWRAASSHYLSLVDQEQDIAETIDMQEIDKRYDERLTAIASDYLFQQAFSMLPIEFRLVEIEKIVAPQRLVNLDKVNQLSKALSTEPSIGELIEFCLAPKHTPAVPKSKQMGFNGYTFSSLNVDFRFLGGYPKQLGEDDVRAALGGCQPVAAIVLLFGYGSPTCNVYSVGKRLILNNGFLDFMPF